MAITTELTEERYFRMIKIEQIVRAYLELVKDKNVYLELRVNPEAPIVVVTGISFQLTWAANGYFRANVNGKYSQEITNENAFEYLKKYIDEET